MTRTRLAALALLLWLAPRLSAGAERSATDLEYTVAAALDGCPDEATFRLAVAQRLGRDPFVSGASRKIEVSLAPSGALLVARVRVEESGVARGERRIESAAGCAELAAGAALAVSIAIDPQLAFGGPAEPAGEPPAAPPPAKPAPPAVPPASPPPRVATDPTTKPQRARPRTFVRAGALAVSGVVPGLDLAPSIGLGEQRGAWSLALDGVLALPRSERMTGSQRAVSVNALYAELSACAHFSALRTCALLASGALFAHGQGVDLPQTGRSFYAAAGFGLGYSFPMGRFALTPRAELAARLERTALSLDGQAVWTTPRGVAGFGLELSYDL